MNQPESSIAWIEMVEGPDPGRKLLLDETPVTIGRGREDDFVLLHPTVTNRQLRIEWDSAAGAHRLVQTGDSCTAVNFVPFPRLAPMHQLLRDGDRIDVGAVVLKYVSGSPIAAPPLG